MIGATWASSSNWKASFETRQNSSSRLSHTLVVSSRLATVLVAGKRGCVLIIGT